jgi:hypothetical protein
MNEILYKAIRRRRISEVREALKVSWDQLSDIDFLNAQVWFPAAKEDMVRYSLAWRDRPAYMNRPPVMPPVPVQAPARSLARGSALASAAA